MDNENVEEKVELEELTETPEVEDTSSEGDDQVDWKERALKAEALIVKNKQKAKAEQEPVKEPEHINNQTGSEERIDRLELQQMGYTAEVVDHIMELGGPRQLKNPIVKKAADDMSKQAKTEKASAIEGSAAAAPVTKYSKSDLDNMSVEELEKILPHADN